MGEKKPVFTKCILALPLLIAFLCATSFAATYDATGAWQFSVSDSWVNPGNAGCLATEDFTATATITQSGDSVTVKTLDVTYTGTVVGSTYTVFATYAEDGGVTVDTLTFTLTTSTTGTGTTIWSWGMAGYSCNGGSALTLQKTETDRVPSEYTGWWYFPGRNNGNGISLEVQNNVLYLAWYTYDESGRPVWYTSGNIMSGLNSYSGEIRVWTGWALGTTPSTFQSSPAGTIQITFLSSDDALVNWTLGERSGQYAISKFMDFIAPGVKDPRDIHGWWMDPAADGMGLFMEAQGGGIYIGWYHYREDGTARWWVSGNVFPLGSNAYSGDLSQWTNGPCIGCTDTAPSQPTDQGNITINFINENQAVLTWDGGQLNLQRFIFYNMQ